MIIVRKINEVYMYIDSDELSEIKTIHDRYTFEIPSAKFSPKYKAGLWDGKIRLFNLTSGYLYIGLLKDLWGFCKQSGIEIKIENEWDFKKIKNAVELEDIENFINDFKLPFEPYEFQIEAFKQAIEKGRQLFSSPTSSGKSFIIFLVTFYYLKNIIDKDKKILILVPNISLCYQLLDNFNEYNNKLDNSLIKIINSEEKKTEYKNEKIVISTWQSVYKNKVDFFDKFDVLIADEVHIYKGVSLTQMMEKTVSIKYKFGFSGTMSNDMYSKVKNDSANLMQLIGLFGNMFTTITTKELMDRGLISKLKIVLGYFKHDDEYINAVKTSNFDYQKEMKLISHNEERRKCIVDMVGKCNGNVLLLFNYKELYGQPLYEDLKKAYPNKHVFYLDGKVNVKERNEITKFAGSRDNDVVLVASYGVYSTGISINTISNIFFVTPYKSTIRVLQSIGRGLRKSKTKNSCLLIDVIDIMCKKGKRENTTLKHAKERMNLYRKQEFNIAKSLTINEDK